MTDTKDHPNGWSFVVLLTTIVLDTIFIQAKKGNQMIAITTLPALTHNDTTVQYRELGIPLDKGDLYQIRVGVNLMKVSAVLPRGDKAIRVMLPGQPLRIELSINEFRDVLHHAGVPTIMVPVPFAEVVAKQLIEQDDLSEFFPPDPSIELEPDELSQPQPARTVTMIVNVLNIAHFGSATEGISNAQVIGLPSVLPIAMGAGALTEAIAYAVRDVEGIARLKNRDVMYNNFYDACPIGWGSK